MEALVNKPKTKRGEETLNRICQAAETIFYEKGYHDASINDITQLASVASGTFYVYFEGKYNLYKYLMLQYSHMVRKHVSQAIVHCKNRREAERVGMLAWLKFLRQNKHVYKIVWDSLSIDKQLFVDYYNNFCKFYRAGLDAAFSTGELREVDTEVLAYALMGISNYLGLNWGLFQEDNSDEELERVTNEFMKILEGGIFKNDFTPQ